MGEKDYSVYTGKIRTFGTVDYVIFSIVLVVSALIGIFYAFKDRKENQTVVFMLGGKSMHVLPVALSLSVTFISALSLLGNPVEIYNFNTMFCWLLLSLVLAVAGASFIFVPFFYKLKITTVFEYLNSRFGTPVRMLCSVIIILQTLVYFAFVLYAPSLALSSVTGISLWGSVVAVGAVVIFYTTLGGMKAVLWTDTFQAMVILAGLLAVLIRGSILTGGISKAWSIADERRRIKFDDFSFDPSTRHSFWSVVVGGGFFWMSLYGINQAQVQRCLSCPNVRKAQIALWINYPCICLMAILTFLIGVVMFAFYADCHPEGIISKRDQMLPLFVMDTLADYDGVPGLFVACIFSGSLSSLSSGLSAISAVTVKDFIEPFFPRMTDVTETIITKVSVVIYGSIGMGCAYLVSRLGRVLQASYSVYGILNGPMAGVFVLGMFFPWANSLGAFVGCITSLAFMSWIGIGAFWHSVSTAVLSPVKTDGCPWKNITTTTTTTMSTITIPVGLSDDSEHIPAYAIYTLSYLYYTIVGIMIVVIVGLIVSFISGHTKPSSLQPVLIFPLFDTLFPCLPEKVLKPLRFGVDHTNKYENYNKSTKDMQLDVVDTPNKPAYFNKTDTPPETSNASEETGTVFTPSHVIYENQGYDAGWNDDDTVNTANDASDLGSDSLEGVPELDDIITKL